MKVTITLDIEAGSSHVAAFYLSGVLRELAAQMTDRHQANLDGLPPSCELASAKVRMQVTG